MADLGTMFGAGEARTFMGLPAWDGTPAPAVLIGADGCTPYASVGFYCAGGPAATRAAAAPFAANLLHQNFDLGRPAFGSRLPADAGDLPVRADDPAGNRALVRAKVAEVVAQGAVPILVGGDDSLPIPMLQALEGGGPLTVLQIDAHIDWRDEVEGERWGLSSTMRRASEMGHVQRIIQVGQRGTGSARPEDVAEALRWGVRFVPARDDPSEALRFIPEEANLVVCLDCDALDPSIMPAVIGRTAGGLSYAQVLGLIDGAVRKAQGRLVAFSLVEFMPSRDVDGLGGMLAAQLLMATLGLLSHVGP